MPKQPLASFIIKYDAIVSWTFEVFNDLNNDLHTFLSTCLQYLMSDSVLQFTKMLSFFSFDWLWKWSNIWNRIVALEKVQMVMFL